MTPSMRRLLRETEAAQARAPRPSTETFWTGHPVVARLRPEYVASNGPDLGSELDREGALGALFPHASRMPADERGAFVSFVTDRVAAYPTLLGLFAPSDEINNLQGALEVFCGQFSDEAKLAALLRDVGVVPKGWDGNAHFPIEMLQMTRRVHGDAADYLWELDRVSNRGSPALRDYFDRIDPNRLHRRGRYDLSRLGEVQRSYPELTPETLRFAYEVMCEDRVLVQTIVQAAAKGTIKFTIFGDGHNVCDAATALALHHEQKGPAGGVSEAAIAPHYRNGPLCNMWAALHGKRDYLDGVIRQQLSRGSDPHSRGRQMVFHSSDPDLGILPVQSPVGMNLTKTVGYALALKLAGRDRAVTVALTGDGTMAESDFYDAFTGASILDLPVLFAVADNRVAISVEPKDGRGLCDLEAYARSLNAGFFTADGNDFLGVYAATREAVRWARENRRPVLFWIQNLSRLNGHSNAGDFRFDFRQLDPLGQFGEALAVQGIVAAEDVTRRKAGAPPLGEYFPHHDLGRIEAAARERIGGAWKAIATEPDPTLASVFEDVRPPFPSVVEPAPAGHPTQIPMNGAIRAAIRDIIAERVGQGRVVFATGQDSGARGGVFQATAGVWERFPREFRDAPINERLILGGGLGCALYPGATAIVEIQFADYVFNAYDWLIHLGNVMWGSAGQYRPNLIVRLPVEPLEGGAVYHSMPVDGFITPIPGLVIVAPSTSRDAYGLMRTAADFGGPVVVLEPKHLYRQALGDAFPGEVQLTGDDAQRFSSAMQRRGIPDIRNDFRVPFGKAAIRRSLGGGEGDVTIVTWGRATLASLAAAEDLAAKGVRAEVIDLRTLVPFDRETVRESVDRTGRLLVVHEDRVSGGFGTFVQHETVNGFPGDWVVSDVLGMEEVPGIPQHVGLEGQIVVSQAKVVRAVEGLVARKNAY